QCRARSIISHEHRRAVPRSSLHPLGGQRSGDSRKRGGTPMTAVSPTLRFLLRHPAHFIALGFGSGLAPFAPGTFGTLVAIPIAALLRAYASEAGFVAAIVLLFALGTWAADVTGRDLGVPDHGGIVIDEIVAFLIVLYFVGGDPLRQAFAFLLFRVFDIAKPPPIR